MQLAVENANAECQRVLCPLWNRNSSLADMIRACQNVGTEVHGADLLAAALSQQMVVANAQRGSCLTPGHL